MSEIHRPRFPLKEVFRSHISVSLSLSPSPRLRRRVKPPGHKARPYWSVFTFFLQGLGVVHATLRPLARPAPRCVRKRLALGFLLTVAQYYKIKMGSVFSCSKPRPFTVTKTPRIPASSPGPCGYHTPHRGLLCGNTRCSPNALVVGPLKKLKHILTAGEHCKGEKHCRLIAPRSQKYYGPRSSSGRKRQLALSLSLSLLPACLQRSLSFARAVVGSCLPTARWCLAALSLALSSLALVSSSPSSIFVSPLTAAV